MADSKVPVMALPAVEDKIYNAHGSAMYRTGTRTIDHQQGQYKLNTTIKHASNLTP
jgi:hypothetical protein